MLEVEHISFSWGASRLLEDVTFSVASGEVAALVGPNGAGKTTLAKILAGLVVPDGGTVCADGVDIFRGTLRYRRMLGYLPESAAAEPDMTIKRYLAFRAKLKGEMWKKIRHRVREAMLLCGLSEHADMRIGRLSFGMRKRVALADALLLRPRFLLLDDLLAGLDAATRTSLGRILATMATFATVLVSGHELDELQTHATRFLVLRDGKISEAPNAAAARAIMMPPEGRVGA